ncbi:DNA-directed DNA polymerase [Malassezia vespertilionis]|uniref:DNA polymerase n=1 Tax=Malassezia vespertilionis TaxID=2020962 RepID=A0A2N1JET2_9BASI|nr:DNA-directed DNA polymerase [Malassezia vespertilionis]PKI85068.1 Rev3p [Malassezia vespertilionis]WFD05727.1 DNA-directed DNA polymerase [Malassezia vespertilionis]
MQRGVLRMPSPVADPALRVYLTTFDYVVQAPGPYDRAQSVFTRRSALLPRVPVVRAFGVTPTGQHACMHIHNVFPYCFVEYKGELKPDVVLPYIQRLGHELNRAFGHAFQQPNREMQLIAAIHLCKAHPFYGYHEQQHYYLKISYVDPNLRIRLASILASGKVMETRFQPMEAHVPFILQWMLDYKLYGCSFMNVKQAHFRHPWPDTEGHDTRWDETTIPASWRDTHHLARDTYSALECDVDACMILNRTEDRGEGEGFLVPSLRALWDCEKARRKEMDLPLTPTPHGATQRSCASTQVKWVASERHKAILDERIKDEPLGEADMRVPTLDEYILDASETVALFHPNGLEKLARESPNGNSAKMFDLGYVHSQSQGETVAELALSLFPSQESYDKPVQILPAKTPTSPVAPQPIVLPPTKCAKTAAAPALKARKNWFEFRVPAPTTTEVLDSFSMFGLPNVAYNAPHYTTPSDIPPHSRTYAGKSFSFRSSALQHLPSFTFWPDRHNASTGQAGHVRWWQLDTQPPLVRSVRAWGEQHAADDQARRLARRQQVISQIDNKGSVQHSSSAQSATPIEKSLQEHMTLLALELLVCTRDDILPDPQCDEIAAVVYTYMHDSASKEASLYIQRSHVILVSSTPVRLALPDLTVVETELELLNLVVDVVRALDPDLLAAYDVHRSSWAYLAERASAFYEYDLCTELGRAKRGHAMNPPDSWSSKKTSSLRIQGRHVINIWRLMQSQVALTQYTLESTVHHILHRRIPHYSHATLTMWLQSGRANTMVKAISYVARRIAFSLLLLEKSGVLFRTAEFARIYGTDFFSVLSRGSQFRVESVLLRITKAQNYILPSPSREQVGQQNAAECIPLILEPRSGMYDSPVLVMDFQSLYPSMMIAYNICYSTCLGRLELFKGTYKLGFTEHTLPQGLLPRLREHVNIMPNGLMFVKRHIRESTLSRMLREVLDTRVMIRQGMHGVHDKALHRRLNAQQLSLKLLANVTYGYAGASASGRMPCVEIADAIVQCGRETLERAMSLIESTQAWGAEVVYGDTDSLFVHLPGRSKQDAFAIGHAISDAVTRLNPEPVKLNFEKVYHPCILVAKKRYVGYKFESIVQPLPVLDVKGLEMIRRDGNLALQRMQEACVRILFDTKDISAVKRYCQRQWENIYAGKVSPLHLITAKQVRLGSYRSHAQLPPGAALAAREMLHDTNCVPHQGERIPFLIRHGPPGAKLNDLAVNPRAVLDDPTFVLHADYYIRRMIVPALARLFNLIGINIQSWLDEMPPIRARNMSNVAFSHGYSRETCLLCGQHTLQLFCQDCTLNPETSLFHALEPLREAEHKQVALHAICNACADDGSSERPPCVSLDCALTYARAKNDADVMEKARVVRLATEHLVHIHPAQDAWAHSK